jgi:DNA-binding NtrC family response regulator
MSHEEPDVNSTDLHILIAEDETSHAVAMSRMLERHYPHARVEVVASIREYCNRIALAKPTIALLDLNLTDGCTLDMLAAYDSPPPFPVVMMSSSASNRVAEAAVKAGAVAFIIKSPDVFLSIADIVERTVREWEQRLNKSAAE